MRPTARGAARRSGATPPTGDAACGSPAKVSYVRSVRVLGVDPGLTRCGVGVVDGVPGRPCSLVDVHVITSEPTDDLAHRLLNLDVTLTELIAKHRPDSVA